MIQLSNLNGVDYGLGNNNGEPAIDIALRCGHQHVLKELGEFSVINVRPTRTFDENDAGDREFRIAEGHFLRMKSWNSGNVQIQSIDIVFNNKLKMAFEEKQAELTNEECGDCCLLFHGTPQENIVSILKNNFDTSIIANGRAHGDGVYFSERPLVSLDYSKGRKSLILCKVLLGKNCKQVMRGNDIRCWAVVVPDIKQILPKYVINFTD